MSHQILHQIVRDNMILTNINITIQMNSLTKIITVGLHVNNMIKQLIGVKNVRQIKNNLWRRITHTNIDRLLIHPTTLDRIQDITKELINEVIQSLIIKDHIHDLINKNMIMNKNMNNIHQINLKIHKMLPIINITEKL